MYTRFLSAFTLRHFFESISEGHDPWDGCWDILGTDQGVFEIAIESVDVALG